MDEETIPSTCRIAISMERESIGHDNKRAVNRKN
jgi:hypothetical protein